MNGVPMVGIVVIPQPGANHIKIADAVYERMKQMKKDLPEDVQYSYGFDNTKFIRASIDEVKETVYVAFILVIIIIFLFLSTLYRNSGFAYRCILRDVPGRILHQCAFHVGSSISSGACSG